MLFPAIFIHRAGTQHAGRSVSSHQEGRLHSKALGEAPQGEAKHLFDDGRSLKINKVRDGEIS